MQLDVISNNFGMLLTCHHQMYKYNNTLVKLLAVKNVFW